MLFYPFGNEKESQTEAVVDAGRARLFSVQCAVGSVCGVQCAVCSAYCTVQCAMGSVNCAGSSMHC